MRVSTRTKSGFDFGHLVHFCYLFKVTLDLIPCALEVDRRKLIYKVKKFLNLNVAE